MSYDGYDHFTVTNATDSLIKDAQEMQPYYLIATEYNITLEQFEEWAKARRLIGKTFYWVAEVMPDDCYFDYGEGELGVKELVISHVAIDGDGDICITDDGDYFTPIKRLGIALLYGIEDGKKYYSCTSLSQEEAVRALEEKRNEK